jgi:hypothetical protein
MERDSPDPAAPRNFGAAALCARNPDSSFGAQYCMQELELLVPRLEITSPRDEPTHRTSCLRIVLINIFSRLRRCCTSTY